MDLSPRPVMSTDSLPTSSPTATSMDTNIQRRPPVRLDAEDGPWSVSVAESPHDSRSYSLYIKTPTHNLTLTRTAMEILDLDHKLRDSNPNLKIPPLPINADSVLPPPKRKSNFLNTLSRLASPTSSKSSRRNTATTSSNSGSTILPTPIASPSGEINDPFTQFSPNNVNSPSVVANPSTTSTGIAAYLTTISNTTALRQARVWKRFVRVRTDDLESVRVERAIKRVRSDLAAHVGSLPKESDTEQEEDETAVTTTTTATTTATNTDSEYSPSAPDSTAEDCHVYPMHSKHEKHAALHGDNSGPHTPVAEDSLPTPVQSPKELDEDDQNEAQVQVTEGAKTDAIKDQSHSHSLLLGDEVTSQRNAQEPSTPPASVAVAPEDIPVPTTPTAPEAQTQAQAQAQQQPQRLVRSHSADPDKSSRLARTFAQSAPASEMDVGTASASSATTGDESTTNDASNTNKSNKRKKRSKSTTTPREAKRHNNTADKEPKKSQRKVNVDDFEMMRVLGKGCAGKVLLVKHKPTTDLYALKAITKRHVLAHQELQHTLTEQAVLKRMAAEGKDPFVVKLWWSFHDKENLFLVMDFHPGGDLATQLARWGRLGRDRARFYAAEIVEGVEGLHAAGVIYRDLKPENILIGADGHIVLTDFGLSKEFPRRSPSGSAPFSSPSGTEISASAAWMKSGGSGAGLSASASEQQVTAGAPGGGAAWPGPGQAGMDQTTTFCGTAEYLAPEVIQGLPYSYEVDWWSFGTMLYEMLTGITPFWANNHSDMYVRVLQDELQFPEDRAMDQDTKSLIRGLLQKNPALRICEPRIKRHPYFSMIDWSHVYFKRYIPPYIPPIDPSNASDTQNFDDTFLDMEPVLDEYVDEQTTDTDQDMQTDTDRTDGEDTATTPSQSRSSSIRPGQIQQIQGIPAAPAGGPQQQQQQPQPQPQQGQQQQQQQQEDAADVFDGYSFKGRHSVLIDSSDEDEEEDEDEDEEGSGSERTGTGIGTESSEAGDDSSVLGSVATDILSKPETIEEEDMAEPKTPEARPVVVPIESEAEPEDIEQLLANAQELESKLEEEEPAKTPTEDKSITKELEASIAEQTKPAATVPVPAQPQPQPQFQQLPQKVAAVTAPRPAVTRNKRRERSGIPALDKDLPEDTETGEDAGVGGIDDEDDDWDFVEAADGEDRNGAKGTSLFARGVVDRYRLAVVFRKASTPSRIHQQQQQRNVSGMSKISQAAAGDGGSASPTTQRVGRSTLAFGRKGPRQFLQPKSQTRGDTPPSSYSSKKSRKSFGAFQQSSTPNSNGSSSVTAMSSSAAGLLTPSMSSGSPAMMSPSLKSKESAVSVGAQSLSSDQSAGASGRANGVEHGVLGGHDTVKMTPPVAPEETPEKIKTKKLKKYKEGAEKMFSLFSVTSSPRGHGN